MSPVSGPLRVFQVASGNVGTEMIKRIIRHPELELQPGIVTSADLPLRAFAGRFVR
ncbi:hypothetical protein [Mycobacterium sp.]|uniref:hypothetical protein n=1 Tax=Mycobacterium sp. TaxID=1785 RepID=UPI003D6A7268